MALLISATANADLSMTAQPLLGVDSASQGWTSYAVRIESTEPAPVKGRVVLRSESLKGALVSEASVTLLPGAPVLVRLPALAQEAWSIQAELLDAQGRRRAGQSLITRSQEDLLLVDLHSPSRLVAVLRGVKVPTLYQDKAHRGSSARTLLVGSSWIDPITGDPILPQRASEWGMATAVLAPSGLLARLGGPEQEALAGYVLGGGTLAVVVERPEDLRQGFLPTLAGGPLREVGTAEYLKRFPSELPQEKSKKGRETVTPTKEVAEALKAYSGGNTRPSDLGTSAPYGLGELHLLPFDPSKAPEVEDPWVQARLIELVRHAWDRHAFVAMPLGVLPDRGGREAIRKQLDPNESGRWSILVAVMLLLFYAVGAGPVNFFLASRAGKPLRALLLLPLLSAAAFFAVVGLALVTKGVQGEARRFGLIEAAGGMSRGTIRRFRGFFTPMAQQVVVGASSEQGLPVLLGNEVGATTTLQVDRGVVELRNVPILPWQTLVISEEDIVPLQGGVALVPEQGDVRITNRLGRDLRGLVVQVPSRGLYHLPTLADGATVLASSGELLTSLGVSHTMAGLLPVHLLSAAVFKSAVEKDSRGLESAWRALENASGRAVDWWPEGQPVLLAQIDGGEGVKYDQGLKVIRDRTLLRVVGYGGEP
ncbi:MAG: hypothetical protein RMJ98_04745 [Myxococcales bacterium]|nr:hypothetical protein [Myxococcales bacterium]